MVKDKILFAVMVLYFVACSSVKYEDKIKIHLGMITMYVVNDLEINCSKFTEGPLSMNFYFDITTDSEKSGVIGSNTYYHYLDLDSLYYSKDDSGIMGRFLIVNRKDTLILCSRGISFLGRDTCQMAANIDLMLSSNRNAAFKDLFCRALKSPNGYKQYLYNYIKNSKFLYVPETSDYEIYLLRRERDIEVTNFIYPDKAINIAPMENLQIQIIYSNDDIMMECFQGTCNKND